MIPRPPASGDRAPVLVPSSRWDAGVWSRIPALASTARAAEAFARHVDFPTTEELSTLVRGRRSVGGAPLVFERQTKKTRVRQLAEAYDARIFHEGRIPTRERSWHDLFNALSWASFPLAKRQVNARQYAALAEVFAGLGKMPGARTREQDALAMLDEGGLLLVTDPTRESAVCALLAANDQPALHALVERGEVHTVLFGHALAEHLVSSTSLVRAMPVVVSIEAATLAGTAEFLGAVDVALAEALVGPFARPEAAPGETKARGVVAIDLRPELFGALAFGRQEG